MPWQFLVVDGADREQVFLLPEKGISVIGGSKKHADICLHDLYVQRTHCEVEVSEGDTVLVRNLRPEGIFVNKARVEQQELNSGDVLRIGNTQMRLERALQGGPAAPSADEPETLEEVPEEPQAAGPEALPSLPPERLGELVGHLLAHYQLDDLLGQGTHKAVFLATDQKSEEQVVVKVVSPRFPARQEELQRFCDVMRRALPLQHESLVLLRGVGKTGPYTWMAREYVPGQSLASILEKLADGSKKLKWQSGVRLARQIGTALEFLHKRQIMHGHLTPRNVLIDVEAKVCKLANTLLDHALFGSQLGVAIKAERKAKDVVWFSPEQCTKGALVDHLSDQYSLGAMVYARLTGRPPFVGATPEETMNLIRTAPLARPWKLNQNIPVEVDAVVVRMLSRKQEDRYHNPAALLADLEALAERE